MGLLSIPQINQLVEALKPQAGDALTGAYISLKNVHRAFVVVHINQANAATVAITLERATAVAGTGTVAIANAVPIWANEDCATSDTMVKKTSAVGFTTSAATKQKIVVFQVDPSELGATYDCLTVKTAASNAANITSALYLLDTRYQGATPPSVITD